MPNGGDTVSFFRQSLSSVDTGSVGAPPSTAAVMAPIEMPVTATGLKPGRCSYSALSTPYSYAPSAPPPCSTTAVWTFPFWGTMTNLPAHLSAA